MEKQRCVIHAGLGLTRERSRYGRRIDFGGHGDLIGQYYEYECHVFIGNVRPAGDFLYYHTVVGDNAGRLTKTLKQAWARSQVIIITGGLGPTQDDLTKETAAEVLGWKLTQDAHTKNALKIFSKSI